MIARLLVQIYFLVHGRLGLPGAGLLVHLASRFVKGLHSYPLTIPGVGTINLDFRDGAAFAIANMSLGETGVNRALFQCVDDLAEPGQVLWDIGANIGYVCLYFVRPPHQFRVIHAFEPNPAAYRQLHSLFQNHRGVKTHPIGLGSADQTLEMRVVPSASACGSLVREQPGAKNVPIQVRHGDRYRKEHNLDLPDIVKIDVEGFEVEVFAGLVETFTLKRPVIVFEHGWLTDEQMAHIESLLPQDYRLGYLSRAGGFSEDPERRGEGDDAIAAPAEKTRVWETLRRKTASARQSG